MSVDLIASAMGRKRDCASSEARYHHRFDVDAQVSDSPRGVYLEIEEIHGEVFEVSSSPILRRVPRVHPQSKHVITSDVISEFAISRLSAAL